MLTDKNAVLQVFGDLLKNPQYLSETDKYTLTPSDFTSTFEKVIFSSIYNLYLGGAEKISRVEIDNYLKDFPPSYTVFEREKGLEYLSDAEELAQPENFPYYYKRIKKFSCLRELKKAGYNVDKIYVENPIDLTAKRANEKFDQLEVADIIALIRKDFLKIESDFGNNGENETQKASRGIENLLKDLAQAPDIGARLQGDYFNTITRGARKGKFYLRSSGSGVGKTRAAVGDACYIAYPIYYDTEKGKWIRHGDTEKVLFIATEQDHSEIQTLILAYLSGVDEEKIISSHCNPEEKERLRQAILVMQQYKDNLFIARVPNPNVEQIKAIVRQNYIVNNIQNVFYDYIFSSPSLLGEFRDLKIREDVALGLLGAALKDLAVELGIFVMSSTQLNGDVDKKVGIKDQTCLRGAKSLADKTDVGAITCRVSDEELKQLEPVISVVGLIPNQVTDIYKVRRGKWTQCRIWSKMDLSTCRKVDLFVTDVNLAPLDDFQIMFNDIEFQQDNTSINNFLNELNIRKEKSLQQNVPEQQSALANKLKDTVKELEESNNNSKIITLPQQEQTEKKSEWIDAF